MKKEKLEKLLTEHKCKRFTKDGENYVCFTTNDFALLIRHMELSPTDSDGLNKFCFKVMTLKRIFENKEASDNFFKTAQSKDVVENEIVSNSVLNTLKFAQANIKLIGLEEDVEKCVIKDVKKAINKLKKHNKEK